MNACSTPILSVIMKQTIPPSRLAHAHRIALGLTVVVAVWLGTPSAIAADNALANPGFESGLKSWSVMHAGKDDPEAAYVLETISPHGGKQCIGYTKAHGKNRNNHFDQIVAVRPNSIYTVSAWIKSDGRLRPLLSIEDMAWKAVAQAKATASNQWQRVATTFRSGARSQVRVVWYGGSKGKRYEGYPGTAWLDDVELRLATPNEGKSLEDESRTDTSGWFDLSLRWDDIAPAPALNAGLHEPPAGQRGFVSARGGHFYFADGTRARFWGVCICGRAAFPTHEQAEIIAARLAKWGINLVRLHALEVQLFDESFDDTRHLSAEMLDRLDYFAAQLKKQGIYIFLDWRTAWRTKKGDGLQPKWLYHWAMLDERFVDLNQNYARLLYLHKNPYTGDRYVDEPAVVANEIVNENDIFSVFTGRERDNPDAERLKQALSERWNCWLADHYGDRAGLARAWTNAAGQCGLHADEDPAKGNVAIPLPAHGLGSWQRDYTATTGSGRASDALLFLYEVQTSYFLRMRDFLRSVGVRVPISGTNWHMDIRPNARSNAQLDFTENHSYWDHAQPWGPNRKGYTRNANVSMLRQDPTLGEETLIDRLNRGRVPGKPFIVTEWNYDSPNEYRCEGPLAMAAYGALQDWDGIICYCFYGNWGTPWDKVAEADELGMFLGSEEIFNDPSIICQFPAAAALFLRGDVRAAQHVVDIGYSATDTFFAQGSWGRDTAALAFLPFVHQTRHAYFGAADSGGSYSGDADLVIASGLSAAGSYEKAKRAILFCDNPASDRHSKQLGREQLVKSLYPQLRFENRADQRIEPRAGWPFEQLEIAMQPGMRVDSLPNDATALGIVATKDVCLGFINEKHLIAPNATALAEAEPAWLYRLVTMATKRWKLLAEGSTADRLVSDTGQLAWNAADGLLTIDTPRTQCAVGFLGGKIVRLADVQIAARTPHCAVALTSLDGQPIRKSARLLLTAVARSENTGQFREDGRTTVPAAGRGRAPVLAEPVEADVVLTFLAGRAAPSVAALDATGKPKRALPITPGQLGPTIAIGKQSAAVFYGIECRK